MNPQNPAFLLFLPPYRYLHIVDSVNKVKLNLFWLHLKLFFSSLPFLGMFGIRIKMCAEFNQIIAHQKYVLYYYCTQIITVIMRHHGVPHSIPQTHSVKGHVIRLKFQNKSQESHKSVTFYEDRASA